jgi:cytochrome c oxidase subunit 1
LGKWHFILTYLGFLFTFFPMHIAGSLGMPRRVAVYNPDFQPFNIVISIAAFVLGFSVLILVYNMAISLVRGKVAGANPWRALTLEWATTSPPPPHNFTGDPVPFEDPYGYGTEASTAYLQALEETFGPPTLPDVPEPEPAPAAAGATGD